VEKSKFKKLCALFAVTYMVSYMTRINFGAVLVEMVSAGMDRTVLALAPTGSFITYGVGQIITGFLGDRIQPKRLLGLGLIVTMLMNGVIPFCGTPWLMVAVWSVNGFAQAFMWPPLVKLMAALFDTRQYAHATVLVSYGSSLGTILIFLLTPPVVTAFGWQGAFFGAAALAALLLPVWFKGCPNVSLAPAATDTPAAPKGKIPWSWLLVGIMLCIMLQGALRDGITTWMPSYIEENYNLGSSVSILTSVLLPVFSMVCFKLTEWIHATKLRNPMVCATVMFGAGGVAALALLLLTGNSTVGSVIAMALLAGCMHGVNLILVCMIPPYFNKTGRVGLMSGLLNSCTYVGSAVSTYGIALLAEGCGWTVTIGVWLGIAVVGTAVCFACCRPFGAKYMK
jgi:OPA family glycerol-3-phosphate transporter-like MFS transporter